jgi:hypothetical protein
MLSQHPAWPEVLWSELAGTRPQNPAARPRWPARLCASLFAGRYDRQVEAGVTPVSGTALAVHRARLTASPERVQLRRALRLVMGGAEVVGDASDVFDAVVQRLAEPLPVRARGMARLRILLADGRGPLYRAGAGSLSAAMRGVLAAL